MRTATKALISAALLGATALVLFLFRGGWTLIAGQRMWFIPGRTLLLWALIAIALVVAAVILYRLRFR
jgi:hypothetical protein